MKVLVTINTFRGNNNGNLVFAYAWKRFLDRFASSIPCDFMFVNNGFRGDELQRAVIPHKVFQLAVPVSVPFDTDETYWPLHNLGSRYDYVIRVDHDAYPSAEQLKAIVSFLRESKVDVVSASNYPRSIEHPTEKIPFLDNRATPMESRKTFHWLPWRYPTQNSDLLVIRTGFFRQVLEEYKRHPKIQRHIAGHYNCPFTTNFLTYGDICEVLSYRDERLSCCQNMRVKIDGSISTDFWTFMCASGMKMAGIVDEEEHSFGLRNHVVTYAQAMQYPSLRQAKDLVDISYAHEKNVRAPYFHIGNGYISESYFAPVGSDDGGFFMTQIRGHGHGFYGAQLALVRELAFRSNDSDLINRINNRTANLFAAYGVDMAEYNGFARRVIEFYRPVMEEYL